MRRRAFSEGLISFGVLAMILATLVAVDERVREQFWLRWSAPSAQISSAGANVRDISAVVFDAARDQSLEHAPLLIFGLTGTVLLMFMLRT
jgi:hypothetical protein